MKIYENYADYLASEPAPHLDIDDPADCEIVTRDDMSLLKTRDSYTVAFYDVITVSDLEADPYIAVGYRPENVDDFLAVACHGAGLTESDEEVLYGMLESYMIEKRLDDFVVQLANYQTLAMLPGHQSYYVYLDGYGDIHGEEIPSAGSWKEYKPEEVIICEHVIDGSRWIGSDCETMDPGTVRGLASSVIDDEFSVE